MAPKFEPQLEPAVLQAIGKVVANFNYLEALLARAVGFLIGGEQFRDPSKVGLIVASRLSFDRLIDVYCSLYMLTFPHADSRSKLKALQKRLQAAERERNRIVHSVWAPAISPGTVVREKGSATKNKGWSVQLELGLPITEIERVAQSLAELSHDMAVEVAHLDARYLKQLEKSAASASAIRDAFETGAIPKD